MKKVKKSTFIFVEENCRTKNLNCLLTLKGEVKKTRHKIVENRLQLHAQKGSGFDT